MTCRGGGILVLEHRACPAAAAHGRYLAMSVPLPRADPLDYEVGRAGRRMSRATIVGLSGGFIASAGVVVFLCAHRIVGREWDTLVAEHARLHELLRAAFGIALLLAGAAIAAVGLAAWCRSSRG